jgi:biotin carboxyl carrier protein
MTKKLYTVAPGTEQARQIALEPVEGAPGRLLVTLGDGEEARQVEVDARQLKDGAWSLLLGPGQVVEVHATAQGDLWDVELRGARFQHQVFNERQMRRLEAGGGALGGQQPELCAPMAGKVIQVLVAPGQAVKVGDRAVVIEAMKMENEIKAHRDGVVAEVRVHPGAVVELNAVLLVIQDEG